MIIIHLFIFKQCLDDKNCFHQFRETTFIVYLSVCVDDCRPLVETLESPLARWTAEEAAAGSCFPLNNIT